MFSKGGSNRIIVDKLLDSTPNCGGLPPLVEALWGVDALTATHGAAATAKFRDTELPRISVQGVAYFTLPAKRPSAQSLVVPTSGNA